MRTTTTTMKTTTRARLKTSAYRVPPSSQANPNTHHPATPHRLRNPRLHQASSELSSLGQDCTGWVGRVEPPDLFDFSFCFCFFPYTFPPPPPPMELRATQHPPPPPPPPHPSPWFSGSPALSIPQFLSTPLYVFSCEDYGTGM